MKHEFLHYIDHGSENDTPIIFIHAFPLNLNMWQPQIEAISNKYRMITYDVRGLGQSTFGDGQYSIEIFVDDLIELMDRLKIDKTIICGISMGGYIALRAIERHPERFQSVILCDTRSESDSNETKIKRFASMKGLKEKNGISIFCEPFIKQAFSPKSFESNSIAIENVRKMILANSPLGISGGLLALASRTDTTLSLGRISIPTLILVGEHDTITPPKAAQEMKNNIQNAKLEIIPDAGHLSNLENPVVFNQKLLKFLASI